MSVPNVPGSAWENHDIYVCECGHLWQMPWRPNPDDICARCFGDVFIHYQVVPVPVEPPVDSDAG